jgi:Uma2 family endonuclease
MHTAVKPLSYDEWLQLPENGNGREECVNGVIETMPPAGFDHAWIVKRITLQLGRQLDANEVWIAGRATRTVITHRLQTSGYLATELPQSAATSPVRFPSVSVDFSGIWP